MQKGDPSWSGYIYAFSIFAGVVWIIFFYCMFHTYMSCWFSVFELPSNNYAACEPKLDRLLITYLLFTILQSLGVLSEAQYFQNVMRTGFRLRSTLVGVACLAWFNMMSTGNQQTTCSTIFLDHSFFFFSTPMVILSIELPDLCIKDMCNCYIKFRPLFFLCSPWYNIIW